MRPANNRSARILQLLTLWLQRIWLYIERGVLTFQQSWLKSEMKYLDKRIAELEKDAKE